MTRDEPVITAGILSAVAAAIVGLIVAFWPGALTDTQSDALLTLVAVVAPLLVAALARGKVTPNSRVLERLDGDDVVAGPANDQVPTGATVRTLPRRAQEAP